MEQNGRKRVVYKKGQVFIKENNVYNLKNPENS